ncbi:DUF6221 family protein [Actinacidiphila acidipaludis]|uniref:DUF6221 family protein n=1 Tax=Actinacidiphila acidipaludis TaxID=2873382 RepID=A0ABS7QDC6_9ACTN|nr:DUF6221 family protein [Streptomyces acidipaludis]MBY8881171.1 DUF6221 family protein [Streptomyces acidipaludis]
MADLIEFLRTRLEEDRAEAERGYARGADDPTNPGWNRATLAEVPPLVARRVLREAEGKQHLLAIHVPDSLSLHGRVCAECRVPEPGWEHGVPAPFPCRTLRVLATVYSDHPDYQPDWKPTA